MKSRNGWHRLSACVCAPKGMRMAWIMAAVIGWCGATFSSAEAQPAASQPITSAPTTQPAANQPVRDHHPDPQIDDLLTKMERKGGELNDLEAEVVYGTEETLVGTNVVRYGTIKILRSLSDAAGKRKGKFLVRFDKVIADGEAAQETEYYLFDGEFLLTRKDKPQLARKQRLVEAGENMDPFKLDGPMPVPFGASKKDMLDTFDISRQPPKDLKELPPPVPQGESLWLTPKPNSKLAKDIRYLLLVVDPDTALPLRVVNYEQQDKIKRAIFKNVKTNVGLPAGTFVLEIPANYQFDDNTKQ